MYPESEYIDLSSKDVLKLAFYVLAVLAVLLTVAVGFALSRWMARQIVEPVERMRDMADAISQGDLDHPVPILSRDEIGDTCQSFEQMRLQLRAARDTRENSIRTARNCWRASLTTYRRRLRKSKATPAVLSTALPIRQKSSAIMWP